MDAFQDYLPAFFHIYTNYYTPYERYLRPFYRYFLIASSYSYRYVFPVVWPIYRLTSNLLSRALSDQPDLATIALLLFIFYISTRLLDMVRRQVMAWISVVVKMGIWAGVALLGFYVYQRGVEQSFDDVVWLVEYLSEVQNEGERIGKKRARDKMAGARRAEARGPRGRTRGGGWG